MLLLLLVWEPHLGIDGLRNPHSDYLFCQAGVNTSSPFEYLHPLVLRPPVTFARGDFGPIILLLNYQSQFLYLDKT